MMVSILTYYPEMMATIGRTCKRGPLYQKMNHVFVLLSFVEVMKRQQPNLNITRPRIPHA